MNTHLQLTPCPEPTCPAPAEIIDRFVLSSTDGPIEYVKTYCLERHLFTVPTSRLIRTIMVLPSSESRDHDPQIMITHRNDGDYRNDGD